MYCCKEMSNELSPQKVYIILFLVFMFSFDQAYHRIWSTVDNMCSTIHCVLLLHKSSSDWSYLMVSPDKDNVNVDANSLLS